MWELKIRLSHYRCGSGGPSWGGRRKDVASYGIDTRSIFEIAFRRLGKRKTMLQFEPRWLVLSKIWNVEAAIISEAKAPN